MTSIRWLPKPLRVGGLTGGPLRPAEHNMSICRARPFDANLTFADGWSTMLRRIGRQLVHGHRYG